MRKQYHFRPSDEGLRAWDVHRLIELTKNLPVEQILLASIRELDEPFWYGEGAVPTCRSVIHHAQLINETDLSFPIILSADGRVMDGMHRVGKALQNGQPTIKAVRFNVDPEPDYIGINPDDLPY
jgi:hypothetical protein